MLASLLTGNRLLASMPRELAWPMDFVAGCRLIGLAAYMFDANFRSI